MGKYRSPQFTAEFDNLTQFVVFLVKAGYGGYKELCEYPVDEFMNLYWYEKFLQDYQCEFRALNEVKE